MGQKVNPNGLRFGIYRNWNSSWYVNEKDYPKEILGDYLIRNGIFSKYGRKLQIVEVKITRKSEKIIVALKTSKSSIIMGEDEKIYKSLKKFILNIINSYDKSIDKKNNKIDFELKILPIKNMNMNAQWIANNIASKIESRGNYKILQKVAISNAMRSGVIGIKTKISGRLNGVDIARSEGYSRGKMPLNTLRSIINYGFAEAHTTYGVIGVKIWIYTGNIIHKNNAKSSRISDLERIK